jgi:RNA recognition motif-containing protein
LFSKCGEVLEAKIVRNHRDGRSLGFGFITYTSDEGARAAIMSLTGYEIRGKSLQRLVACRFGRFSPCSAAVFGLLHAGFGSRRVVYLVQCANYLFPLERSAYMQRLAVNSLFVRVVFAGKRLKVSFSLPQSKMSDSLNVFVSGLPRSFGEPELNALVAPFGDVVNCKVLRGGTIGA